MNKSIFQYNGKKYYKEDIIEALKEAGIQKGDTIFVHSDLKSFGKINSEIRRDEFLESFYRALLETVGKEGNIIMPTFTYSFCKKEFYDPMTTPSTVGILTEFFRKLEGVRRSIDPIFSVAAIGPDKDFFTYVGTNCFGEKSIFEKIFNKNSKIIFLGETFDITYMHFVEQKYNVPYRFIKKFNGKIKLNGELKDYTFDYNVRPLDKEVNYNLEGIANFFEKQSILSISKLGNSKIRVVNAIDAFNEITKGFKNNIYLLLKNKPISINNNGIGKNMYDLIKKLFPICRSITGNGVRKTLTIIQKEIPIKIHEVPTGTNVFDWTVPKEWNIKDAYVMDEEGNKIIDFKKHNLHVVGYSVPVDKTISLEELQKHLYSLPDQPDAIPYVTSYYKERWGFCIKHKDREKLKDGNYKVFIDSELKNGSLTYGELIIPGKSDKEVFLSTYVCHPSMANNELSGPAVTVSLIKWIMKQPRKYTYRIIFIPETIGSITYLSKNIDEMKKNIIAGFNISCVGDNGSLSYLPSRNGNTYADKIALNVLSFKQKDFIKYSFLDKGSDERQYNSPGVDLPVCCILKSKYGTYPEYHTSLDDLEYISPQGLSDSYDAFKECLKLIEENEKYKIKCLGEPQLGKRGLYPTISTKSSTGEVKNMMNFIAYADGKNDLIDISNKIGVPVWELYPIIEKLLKADLLEVII